MRVGIALEPLPGYSPDFMPVEALWRWLLEDVTDNRCHTTRDELFANVRRFQAAIHRDPVALSERLWVKDTLDPGGRNTTVSEVVVVSRKSWRRHQHSTEP